MFAFPGSAIGLQGSPSECLEKKPEGAAISKRIRTASHLAFIPSSGHVTESIRET